MLRNEDIICISWLVWDSIPLVMHEMMKRLARNNRVLFVDPPVAYSNLAIHPSLWRSHWNKTRLWIRGARKALENLYVYYPPPLVVQYGHLGMVDRFNQAITAHAIQKVASQLRIRRPILWIFHPYAVSPRGQFNEKIVIYDCNDDIAFFFSQMFPWKRKKLATMEEALTRHADVVFATSTNLFRTRRSQNANTHYCPSGVDFDNFHRALSPSISIPSDLESIPKPIIGFVGGMTNSKMNWEYIKEAACQNRARSFVFIGPCVDTPPEEITRQENIFFLGSRDPESLPGYIKAFDLCIIPYKGEDFLKNCFPTKVFEYLAAGKPVLSSYIPALKECSDVVRLVDNSRAFTANIEVMINCGKQEAFVDKCVSVARGRTWENRVKVTAEVIEVALRSRG
jgi:glycosyltransferase involved in cell wall biosynthesis